MSALRFLCLVASVLFATRPLAKMPGPCADTTPGSDEWHSAPTASGSPWVPVAMTSLVRSGCGP